MPTNIDFQEEAKAKLLRGAAILARAVGTTLGPRGRNVGIDRKFEKITLHDGVTIAKAIELKDPVENFGAHLLKVAADNTVQAVGDGTTATVILADSITTEAHKLIATGLNPMALRVGLESGAKKLIDELEKISTPIKTLEEKIQVATISAEDPDLGELVGKTIQKVGTEGVITIEESKGAETTVEHQEGMQFDKGFKSYEFITDPVRLEATVENADILISERNVTNIYELQPFLEKYGREHRNFVIIAPDITDSALASFVVTKLNGGMNVLCIQSPSFGDKQKDWLTDIAILTGAQVVSDAGNMRYENLELDILGHAARVTSDKDATIIVGGEGDKKAIKDRIAALRKLSDEEDSDFEKEKLKERIAKLSGGVAVIKVGGHTEVEMKERKERAEDAVGATKAAVEGGIVAGGEVAYLRVREVLNRKDLSESILYSALEKPFDKLVTNAGLEAPVERAKVLSSKPEDNMGIDVTTGHMVSMIKDGIIDPTLVAENVINNAVSVAVQLISIDAVVTPIEERKDKNER